MAGSGERAGGALGRAWMGCGLYLNQYCHAPKRSVRAEQAEQAATPEASGWDLHRAERAPAPRVTEQQIYVNGSFSAFQRQVDCYVCESLRIAT